ncbi:hypothetical protein SVAN01_10805 [Stagonosporopsis vannaccii]|nr:hypothetical protein SVAN01_10805 [Stagonosporopsis vannaccii]
MAYTATDGRPQEDIAVAEEIASSVILHLQSQVAEQMSEGVHHPYASGTFTIEHSKEGAMFVAQLTFYPLSMGSDGIKTQVVEKGKSSKGVVEALQFLRHYVDPTRLRNGKGAAIWVGFIGTLG